MSNHSLRFLTDLLEIYSLQSIQAVFWNDRLAQINQRNADNLALILEKLLRYPF